MATSFQMGKGDSRHLVSPEMGAEQMTLNYSVFQPGHEFPQHMHDVSADIFIVLEGGVSVRQGDVYTPIAVGDLAYIPSGEVHGTVNQTDAQAILISFQSPPDVVMYRGERDPAVTGSAPKPPPGHVSTVQIRQLASGERDSGSGYCRWTPVSRATGAKEMLLHYYEVEPDGCVSVGASPQSEAVWFVWAGTITLDAQDEALTVPQYGGVFVPPGEEQMVRNRGARVARLIYCEAMVT